LTTGDIGRENGAGSEVHARLLEAWLSFSASPEFGVATIRRSLNVFVSTFLLADPIALSLRRSRVFVAHYGEDNIVRIPVQADST